MQVSVLVFIILSFSFPFSLHSTRCKKSNPYGSKRAFRSLCEAETYSWPQEWKQTENQNHPLHTKPSVEWVLHIVSAPSCPAMHLAHMPHADPVIRDNGGEGWQISLCPHPYDLHRLLLSDRCHCICLIHSDLVYQDLCKANYDYYQSLLCNKRKTADWGVRDHKNM